MAEEPRSLPPTVWDPNCPHRLLILPSSVVGGTGKQEVNYLWSHTGSSSCNKHEVSALIKIIQAHGHYHERLDREASPAHPSKVFSRKVRHAVHDCLCAWMEELEDPDNEEKEKTELEKKEEEHSMENLEMLKVAYSAMHLSDVILPLLPAVDSWASGDDDLFGISGAASADFIRYLRSHHMDSAECLDDNIPEMLQSKQPDQYGGGTLYWQYIETLVIRGQLEEAWSVLERHSQYQSAVAFLESASSRDKNPEIVRTMKTVQEEFLILREVLLRAPLPGGRTDLYDNDIDVPDVEDEEMDSDFYLTGLDVNSSHYKYWEVDTHGDDSGDSPIVFTPKAAMIHHDNWQKYVERKVRHKLLLSKWVPEIDKIVSILCGDFSGIDFEAWPEKLCAEILYRKPDCRPRDLSGLTKRAMKEFQAQDEPFAGPILKIMAGDAGTAIATLYQLGGSSGAALPTTLLAVLYNMFLEARIIPNCEETLTHKTEFITEAALAIVSSLASNDSDVGVDLATRLLIPYLLESEALAEVAGCLAEILEHYNPSSDVSAKTVLDRCEKLLKQQPIRRVMEACVAIVVCRYRWHRSESRSGLGFAWLARGIKMEALIIENIEEGSCYNMLCALCYSTSESILKLLATYPSFDEEARLAAKEIAVEIERDGLSKAGVIKIRELPPVEILMQIHTMLESYCVGDRFLVPKCVAACLEKGSDGPVPMPRSLQVLLLDFVCKLVENATEEVEQAGGLSTTSTFDKRGTSSIMESVVLAEFSGTAATEDFSKMKNKVLRCLSQACVAENALKRPFRDADSISKSTSVVDIRTDALASYAPNVQEAVVQRMLDF